MVFAFICQVFHAVVVVAVAGFRCWLWGVVHAARLYLLLVFIHKVIAPKPKVSDIYEGSNVVYRAVISFSLTQAFISLS